MNPAASGAAQVSWSKLKMAKTLEKLALDVYLSFLEDSCATYIRLLHLDNQLLREVRDNMITCLKDQLRSHLNGTISTVLR
jgi:hypothetical protein